jgi:opacity protein-like surface antigen
MRWVICVVVALAFAPSAFAEDLDTLRGPQILGPPAVSRWSGFYFGGQAAYTGGTANFKGSTQGPLAAALLDTVVEADFNPSSWPLLGDNGATTSSFGAFVGYNTQWQDLVLGAEINYSSTNMPFNAPSTPMTREFSTVDSTTQAETLYNLTGSASGTLRLIDYASFRARAGWIVSSNFLPYAFGGFVLGRGDYTESASVTGPTATTVPTIVQTATGPITYVPAPVLPCNVAVPESCGLFAAGSTNGAGETLMYGVNLGAGVDIALMSNVFLRAEFEYVHFMPYNGIVLDLATGRIGAGLKF